MTLDVVYFFSRLIYLSLKFFRYKGAPKVCQYFFRPVSTKVCLRNTSSAKLSRPSDCTIFAYVRSVLSTYTVTYTQVRIRTRYWCIAKLRYNPFRVQCVDVAVVPHQPAKCTCPTSQVLVVFVFPHKVVRNILYELNSFLFFFF